MSTKNVRLKLHRHTAAEWTASALVPLDGEPCWSTDTDVLKIGDGTNVWSALTTVGSAVQTPWLSKTTTEMNALTPTEGMAVWNTTEHQLYVYDGLAWVGVPMQA